MMREAAALAIGHTLKQLLMLHPHRQWSVLLHDRPLILGEYILVLNGRGPWPTPLLRGGTRVSD